MKYEPHTEMQRYLFCSSGDIWQLPKFDGQYLITPDNLRWRIEQDVIIPDLVHPGDLIQTSDGTKGIVVSLHKYQVCCCPYSDKSRTKICMPHWDGPTVTDYHIAVNHWTITFVDENAKQDNAGDFHERDYKWLNELVAFNGRVLHLYENNNDEVFVLRQAQTKKPFQISLF